MLLIAETEKRVNVNKSVSFFLITNAYYTKNVCFDKN